MIIIVGATDANFMGSSVKIIRCIYSIAVSAERAYCSLEVSNNHYTS